MLGIVFTGAEGPPPVAIKQLIGGEAALVAKDTLLIAADSGLLMAEEAGLWPHWLVGDMDSIDTVSRLEKYPPERIIYHKADKDYTDTELAFSLALEKGCGEVWIIGGGGGRIDHLFGIRSLFERDVFPSRWVTGGEDIRCIEAAPVGTPLGELSLDIMAGALVSVFPLGGGPWKAKSSGLKWPLDNLSWSRGFFGLSNIAVKNKISITAEAGRFMVIIPLPPEQEEKNVSNNN